jgi:hypothetical protein
MISSSELNNWTGNLFSSKKKINKKVEKFKTFWHKVAQFFHLNTQWLWKLTFLYNFLWVHLQNSLIWKRFIYSLSKNSKNKVTKGKWSVNKPQTVKKSFCPLKLLISMVNSLWLMYIKSWILWPLNQALAERIKND